MESAWAHESPGERFLRQLRRQRALMFMKNREYMKALRYDNERAVGDQKAFGKIWAEYGVDVYQLIAEACGETWDAEDEQKKEGAVNQSENDDLVTTRKKGSRQRQFQFQRKSEASKRFVEEDQGQGQGKVYCGSSSPKGKGPPASQKESGTRRTC